VLGEPVLWGACLIRTAKAMGVMRFYNTARHLKARQILARLRRNVVVLYEDPSAFWRQDVPPLPACHWLPKGRFLAPGPQANTPEQVATGRLTFLNRTARVGWPPQWSQEPLPKLWQYNLHYFEYLWALDYPRARSVVSDWIARHELRKGQVGWEPYPTSLRLVNWCCVFFGRFRADSEADAAFRDPLWRSIFLQAEWLSRHVETHLMGNHLLENGVALAVVGSCFAGAAAERWLRRGLGILAEQLDEQILPDGGHFERSCMYHARVLYSLLMLACTGQAEAVRTVMPFVGRMMRALACMCHPDGRIALLNDSALDVCNHPSELIDYADSLLGLDRPAGPAGAFALAATGYYGTRGRNGNYLICDAGPVGPDYIPGHGHGDVFSFELSLNGRRVIVDSGVHGYEPDALRRYCRSTEAHNTVEIDGRDQCEFWSAFRVGRRPRLGKVDWMTFDGGFHLTGCHDGYASLPGGPMHRREFTWHGPDLLSVADAVTSEKPVRVISRLHLHPQCEVVSFDRQSVTVRFPGGRFSVRFAGPGQLRIGRSLYCPRFGVAQDNTVLEFESRGKEIRTGFSLACEAADAQCPGLLAEALGSGGTGS